MIINSATSIYFSPTGTTKKIIDQIIKGMGLEKVNLVDLTLPKIRESVLNEINEDIVLIGVPVYEDKVPEILLEFLNNLKGNNKPVILVCVYGNITDGITLNELYEITENNGFKVIAAGSFIGEHSFSTKKLPVAEGRPNYEDLSRAEIFGAEIVEKLKRINEISDIHIKIPEGKIELMAKVVSKNSARMFTKQPMVDKSICNDCGVCVYFCPMAAINQDTLDINEDKCIRCFACVKRCPKKAREIIYKKKLLVTNVLRFKSRIKRDVKTYL
ncbi:ferredoxin [Clostridium gelidum]|uniref:Ferredoxin n=1 Tax=Clostridium gelidum TaxID=704125 RepID=A0ABM7T8M7_9CLOT|nr:EFR1 family ferrodoxin [Clostridium gelidum]BCZ48326.1 ferredoxin [Clostridium gelidum]